jgi:hypothetical protein
LGVGLEPTKSTTVDQTVDQEPALLESANLLRLEQDLKSGSGDCPDQPKESFALLSQDIDIGVPIISTLETVQPITPFTEKEGKTLCQPGYHFDQGSIITKDDYSYSCIIDEGTSVCSAQGAQLVSTLGFDSCCHD